jgi:hypothetical protein
MLMDYPIPHLNWREGGRTKRVYWINLQGFDRPGTAKSRKYAAAARMATSNYRYKYFSKKKVRRGHEPKIKSKTETK